MSEPRVTITLGSSGQVVKKGGSKRSRGEKGGVGFSSSSSSSTERHQGDGLKFSPGLDRANGSQIAQNDLRLKLMQKRQSMRIQNGVDECEKMEPFRKLSRPIQLPASSYRTVPNGGNLSRRVLPRELPPVDSSGKFYSSQSVGGSRARSPDRMWRPSSAMLRPRSFGSIRPAPADYPRYGRYTSAEVPGAPRLTGSTPSTLKAASPASNLVARAVPTSAIVRKVRPMVEEPTMVTGFLNSLGLGKYADLFHAEEVDMTVLKQMGDKDLKDMGIPMGPRKKILLSLLPPQKRQVPALRH